MVVALGRDFESISCTNLVLLHDGPQKAGGGVGAVLDTGLLCSALLPVWPARAVLLPLNTSGSASLLLTEAGTSTQSLNHFLANTVKPH